MSRLEGDFCLRIRRPASGPRSRHWSRLGVPTVGIEVRALAMLELAFVATTLVEHTLAG